MLKAALVLATRPRLRAPTPSCSVLGELNRISGELGSNIADLHIGGAITGALDNALPEAERARFIVQRAMQEKKQSIIRAQGEAQSAKLIGEAMSSNPAFLSLRRIEAARAVAHTISGAANKVYLHEASA